MSRQKKRTHSGILCFRSIPRSKIYFRRPRPWRGISNGDCVCSVWPLGPFNVGGILSNGTSATWGLPPPLTLRSHADPRRTRSGMGASPPLADGTSGLMSSGAKGGTGGRGSVHIIGVPVEILSFTTFHMSTAATFSQVAGAFTSLMLNGAHIQTNCSNVAQADGHP